jgi:beta-N-acetylhexosaminidase
VNRPGVPGFISVLGTIVVALTVVACGQSAPTAPSAPTASSTPRLVQTLTPVQLAGQRVIYSYKGLTPPPGLLWLIRHGQAAGVVFFADNIAGHAQIREVVDRLERADQASTNPVRAPLLLLTDQEGGPVRRLSGPPLLSEKQVGEADDPEGAARGAGAGAARNLASVGMNVNLAPVLDVFRAAGDFDDQYGRSYSSDPQVVATLGSESIAAQQRAGVAATAKHFPGLGAASRAQNTDLRAVTLPLSLSTIRDVDEYPYHAAIAAGVRLVMLSWAVYPALDPGRPAGLSPAVVGGELRGRLGFRGVAITDALEAGALARFGTYAQRSVLAAQAGVDLVLCSSGHVSEGDRARAGLLHGYGDGTLDKDAFLRSVGRILALRRSLAD